MNRLTNERQWSGASTEEECLREASQLGLTDLMVRAMPEADDGSPSQRRMSRLMQALESEIIPRLIQAHGPRAAAPVPVTEPVWPDVRGFARQTYAIDDAPMRAAVDRLLDGGCPVERLFLELLSPAARELGLMWEQDACNFTDVTVGVGRLQQMLRELSPAFGAHVEHPADGRRILLLPAPGEQHTFGASMVAEYFRRAGWDVVGGVGGSAMDPVQMVQTEWFDILGLSAGHLARVDWLRECIAGARQGSRNRGIGVLVGGPLFTVQPEVGPQVGSDAVVVDGQQAPERAEALLASRIQRV